MKDIAIAALLSCTFLCSAQLKRGDQAVLKQCTETVTPFICTNQKLEVDVSLLVTPEIMSEIRKGSDKDHFTIAATFISDAAGKVIPSETKVLCEHPVLEKKIRSYVNTLPAFEPKDETHNDRRSVHFISITYVYDHEKKAYYIADRETLIRLKIKPDAIPLDTYPVYPGCEGSEQDGELKCLSAAMNKTVIRNFRVPEVENDGVYRMVAHLIIEKDGQFMLQDIEGAHELFTEEIKRVIKELPVVVPGTVSKIPVRVSCHLPITLNISN